MIDDVTVVHVDLVPDSAREGAAFDWLDRNERDRWRQFRVDRARRQFALCRAELRANLCARLACTNQQLSFGFNASHSGMHGLIAFASRRQLGVDVEERVARPDLDGIGETVFGPREQSALAESTGNRKIHLFFTLWTI